MIAVAVVLVCLKTLSCVIYVVQSFLTAWVIAGFAAVKQSDLQDMLLGVPRLLEFVGRNMGAKPHLLGVLHSFTVLPARPLHAM